MSRAACEALIAAVDAAVRARDGCEHGGEVRFRCPEAEGHEHGDRHPSADWNRKKAVWCCRVCGAGGGVADLAGCLGIDLRRFGDQRPDDHADVPDLVAFAHERCISAGILTTFDVKGVVYRTRPALRYPTSIGIDRIKFLDRRKPKYCWVKRGGERHWYGLERALSLVRAGASVLYVVNGEPSVWACAPCGVPAVCLCAGEATAPSTELIENLRLALGDCAIALRIVFDADAAGHAGAKKAVEALKSHGFVDVAALDLGPLLDGLEHGDVDDLHRLVGDRLPEALSELPHLDVGGVAASDRRLELPCIVVSGQPLREKTNNAIKALRCANEPPVVFVRGAQLARVRSDERARPIIDAVGEAQLRGRLTRIADFIAVDRHGAEKHVSPPMDMVRDALALGTWPFPALEAVVETPVLRADGTVLETPGYDDETRLIYCPAAGLSIPRVPATPSSEQLRAAIAKIIDVFADFPFVDVASAANLLGLLLTPLLRTVVMGPVPIALLDKPKMGTGASLLAEVIAILTTGRPAAMMTAPTKEEEWRKHITATLLSGATLILIDNVEHPLASASLAAALTCSVWEDRVLGRSEMVQLPQRATWACTGNNIRLGGDLPRRTFWVRLDPQHARPWKRTGFRHPDLLSFVTQERGGLLAAALTVVRAWFAAGCPTADVPVLGGFKSWARIVGGVLAYAGIKGFLANQDDLFEQLDEETPEWVGFITAWYATFGDRAVTVADLTTEVQCETSPLREALPADLAESLDGKGSFSRRLGKALARRADQVFDVPQVGTLRLIRAGSDAQKNAVRWRVVVATSRASDGFPGFAGLGTTATPQDDRGHPADGVHDAANTTSTPRTQSENTDHRSRPTGEDCEWTA